MSITPAGRQLTEAHRLLQGRIGNETTILTIASFRLLDPTRIDATIDRWLATAIPIIHTQRAKSAKAAANYMTLFRRAELGTVFSPVPAGPAPVEQLAISLTVTGPVSLKKATAAGAQLDKAVIKAAANAGGAAMRHALNGGRDTIVATVDADPRALGWARATSGNSCFFCLMLASRGPVYLSEQSADFQPHDRCHCQPEPAYSRDAAWPPGSEKARELWDQSTRGLSGNDAIKAFRGALGGE